jgi:hypothetical protein
MCCASLPLSNARSLGVTYAKSPVLLPHMTRRRLCPHSSPKQCSLSNCARPYRHTLGRNKPVGAHRNEVSANHYNQAWLDRSAHNQVYLSLGIELIYLLITLVPLSSRPLPLSRIVPAPAQSAANPKRNRPLYPLNHSITPHHFNKPIQYGAICTHSSKLRLPSFSLLRRILLPTHTLLRLTFAPLILWNSVQDLRDVVATTPPRLSLLTTVSVTLDLLTWIYTYGRFHTFVSYTCCFQAAFATPYSTNRYLLARSLSVSLCDC